MLVVVKKPHTDHTLFEVKGDIPSELLQYLTQTFGQDVEALEPDEEWVDIFSTAWYQETRSQTTPGEILKIYRENRGMSQAELGRRLGETWSRQKISDLEHNRRPISKDIGKKLSRLFGVPVERFLYGIE
ncbi:Helix-turn-helix protein [Candidatus Desulfarcum epimagneticum]|uniref:Helix-turn-helix protein n=1 Tax=uncultured Desulfobacteraceae bacterium TaxID=218296 RepID=A0A484HJ96_9BACT|nr:Helix-turn-helix protein [uncultured Desulfobacteraceae bacterium]